MTVMIATISFLPPSSQNQQANHASYSETGLSFHLRPATGWFSDLVCLGLTSAKWCSRISLTDILSDLMSSRPLQR